MFAFAGVIFLMPFVGLAQRGSGGWCSNNNYHKLFDPKNIQEFKGEISSIEKITPESGMSVGVHLVVKSGKNAALSVHLGPSWFLENQDVQFSVGDLIQVKGSKISYLNAPAIIAMTVIKGDQVLTLRNNKGVPVWNAWKQGRKMGGRNQKNN